MQKRILIVDDEPAIREMVAFALRKGDYDPIHAGDAREAQTAIADRVPDLILLDWMLPGTSGLDLARRWRKEALTREVPIIMLTARGEENDRVGGLEAGVDDYVVKPFSPRELLAGVPAGVRRARAPALHRGAGRHGLGVGEGLGAAVEAVAGGREFGQHDELRAAGHRRFELLAHGSGVAREVLDADLRVELHDGHAHGAGAQAGHGVAAGGNVVGSGGREGHGHFRFQIKTRWMLAASVLICNQSNATV